MDVPTCTVGDTMKRHVLFAVAASVFLASTCVECNAQGLVVPAYNSRPGANYTLYLDFAGFSYTGHWNGNAPGVVPAYTIDADAANFSAQEQTNMQIIWARVAEKYTAYNVNVTTVDPAIAAGKNGSDLMRQTYYDNTAQLMHTVI